VLTRAFPWGLILGIAAVFALLIGVGYIASPPHDAGGLLKEQYQ
jgi:hypothetical protein